MFINSNKIKLFQRVDRRRSNARRLRLGGCLLLIVAALPALAQIAPAPAPVPARPDATGLWIDHTGRGAVDIQPCGTQLCGTIAWMKEPMDPQGKPLVDINNPERTKRTRWICGLPIIGNAAKLGKDVWDNGWIYDPDDGKTYDLELKLKSPDVLQVTGYLGTKFFSETYTWRRASATQPRCTPKV
jgi:uncharacterized protein (DUF2147 family)